MINDNFGLDSHDRKMLLLALCATIAWFSLLFFSHNWIISNIDNQTLELAKNTARDNFNKDLSFRRWGTSHGGVYVPITEETQPSQWLSHIPDRDITTPSGRKLTLLNPAFMVRQLMENYGELYGIKGRITSKKYFNPNNKPDEWEEKALTGFENGLDEAFEITTLDGGPYLRLMRPMTITQGCLKCHGNQGYKVGDIRGGVGVSVPLIGYYTNANVQKRSVNIAFAVVTVVSLFTIIFGFYRAYHHFMERRRYELDMWRQANFDSLTGLVNSYLFINRLEQKIELSKRHEEKFAVLYIDLDRFKDVNDARGHDVGDVLLCQVAEVLLGCVRASDTVVRLGGDEFAVIVNKLKHKDNASVLAKHILHALDKAFDLNGSIVKVSASIGISIFPDDAQSVLALRKNADTAMYQAKAEGRNTFRFFTAELDEKIKYNQKLETAMREAHVYEQFSIHYQPQISIETGKVVGAEALIRWNPPNGQAIPPDQFIPVAEETGLIVDIGCWVLTEALTQMKQWQKQGLALQNLSINISSVQCHSNTFVQYVSDLLKELSIPPQMITLEITESVFIGQDTQGIENIFLLAALGVVLSIDDFGTGYSSLSYLKRLPVKELKIDQSFIRDVITDNDDASLCRAITSMGSDLGLRVIAEGVELTEQLEFLKKIHCNLAQGYLFSKPLPAVEFREWLKSYNLNN